MARFTDNIEAENRAPFFIKIMKDNQEEVYYEESHETIDNIEYTNLGLIDYQHGSTYNFTYR